MVHERLDLRVTVIPPKGTKVEVIRGQFDGALGQIKYPVSDSKTREVYFFGVSFVNEDRRTVTKEFHWSQLKVLSDDT